MQLDLPYILVLYPIPGCDGLKIWDLKNSKELEVPQLNTGERGQVSCVFWITRQNEVYDTLCYGNSLGFLVILQHSATGVCDFDIHAVSLI